MLRENARIPDSKMRNGIILAGLTVAAMLIVVALIIEGLVILVHARALQNAVDDGAIVAALQLNQGMSPDHITDGVTRIMTQDNIVTDRLEVQTCDTIPLVDWEQRDYIDLECDLGGNSRLRVYAEQVYSTVFLHWIGIETITLRLSAVADISTAELR